MIELLPVMDTNNPLTEKLIEYFAWPLSISLALMFAIFILRNPLSNLINRTRNISRSGIDITTPQSSQVKEMHTPAAEELMRVLDSAVLLEQEKNIKENIKNYGLVKDDEIQKILIRLLAANHIELSCEKTYREIYGSQIKVLQHLNCKGALIDTLENIKKFYDDTATKYPQFYKKYPFDSYIKFLTGSFLVKIEGEHVKITSYGIEFLGYLVKVGLTAEKPL